MKETEALVLTLKHCLRARGITYADLARRLQLSEASVKRLFSRGTFTLKRLEDVCVVLGISIYELSRMTTNSLSQKSSSLPEAVEEALVRDRQLFVTAYLLLSGWSPRQITSQYKIGQADLDRHLLRLDRLGVIELHPKRRIKVMIPHESFTWIPGGPIQRSFERSVRAEFFDSEFRDSGEYFGFGVKELSSSSQNAILRKLKEVLKEFESLGTVDAQLSKAETKSVGLAVAIRPWTYSLFSDLKRSP